MLLCDTHADLLFRMATEPGEDYDITLDKLTRGGVSLQVLTLFVGRDPASKPVREMMDAEWHAYQQLLSQGWQQITNPTQAEAGRFHFMLSLEGCEPFTEGLHVIRDYHQRGIRMAAITWNHENALGSPATKNTTDGLKPYGFEAVLEMQKLKIAIDVSHLNIPGFYDLLNKTNAPPLASHSCARALRDHPRNLTDQQLKDLFAAGGYVGVNFCPAFLVDPGQPCTINSVIDHIDHMHQMGGAGMVGFGSDFDGIDEKPQHLENAADFPNLLEGLRKRGYKEQDIENIAGKNLLQYYQRING
jgi:membrane dipeptidase